MQDRKYILLFLIIALLSISGYFLYQTYSIKNQSVEQQNDYEEIVVKNLVDGFGRSLKNVSLLAKPKAVAEDIKNNYSPFVSQDLILQWTENLVAAPGRTVSSPWPDRIEITSLEKLADQYTVAGSIIYVTAQDLLEGKFSDKRGITLVVEKKDNSWLITSAALEPVAEEEPDKIDENPVEDGVACTMDARLCPDGSYVGRTGPNCEFKPCPGE